MAQETDRALGMLGMARKAGKLQVGEETVSAMLTEKHARLTVLASDAGDAVSRKIRGLAEGSRQRVLSVPYDKLRLGAALGRPVVSVAAFADVSMALAFVKTLPEGLVEPALLQDLEKRVSRVKARRSSKRNP